MRLLGKLYEALWRPTAGRPWTYASRELSQQHPRAFLVGILLFLAALMVVPGALWSWWWVLALGLGLMVGIPIGHIWWDTAGKYVPDKWARASKQARERTRRGR